MSVHYKFKSALEYDTITFDGLHISVKDLKNAIIQQKRIGKSTDFDLQVTNAQTKEVYTDENVLIPKNTSLLIARIPNAAQSKPKQWEGYGGDSSPTIKTDDGGPIAKATDLSCLDAPEDDKIKAMMSQSTQDYDPSNYQKIRGSNQMGAVPPTYRCYKCHQTGHWIKDCTFGQGTDAVEIKKSTGIPQSFMVPVDGPQVPGAMMTPNGSFAVPVLDHQAYNYKPVPAPVVQEMKPDIPEDLVCSICSDLLADAVMIPCCGNSFCDECIRFFLLESEDHECPDCHEKDISPVTLIPNRFLRKSVANFKNTTGYIKKTIFRPPPRETAAPKKESIEPPQEIKTEADKNEKTVISEADSTELLKNKPVEKKEEKLTSKSQVKLEIEQQKDGPPGVSPIDSPVGSQIKRLDGSSREVNGRSKKRDDYSPKSKNSHSSSSQYDRERSNEDRAGTPTVDEPGASSNNYQYNSENSQPIGNIMPISNVQGPPPNVQRSYPPGQQPISTYPPTTGPPPNFGLPPPNNVPYMPPGPYANPPRPIFDPTRPPMAGPPPFNAPFHSRPPHHREYERGMRNRTPPGIIDDTLAAFNKILREKDERERRAKARLQRRTYSRSRSRSRSYSPRSPRRMRSRSPRRRSRSRSFSLSRSRSRSYSVSIRGSPPPYRERDRDYSPRHSPRRGPPPARYRSPVRSPPRRYKEPHPSDRRDRDDYDREYRRDDRDYNRDHPPRRDREHDRTDREYRGTYDNFDERYRAPKGQWNNHAMGMRAPPEAYYNPPPPEIAQGYQPPPNRCTQDVLSSSSWESSGAVGDIQYPPREYPPPYMGKPDAMLPIHAVPPRKYEDVAPPGVEEPPVPGLENSPRPEDKFSKVEPPPDVKEEKRTRNYKDADKSHRSDRDKDREREKHRGDREKDNKRESRKERDGDRKRRSNRSTSPQRKRSHSRERETPEKRKRKHDDSSDREKSDKEKKREHSDDEKARKSKDKKKKKEKERKEKDKKKRDKKEKHKEKDKEKKVKEEAKEKERNKDFSTEEKVETSPSKEVPAKKFRSDSPKPLEKLENQSQPGLYDDVIEDNIEQEIKENFEDNPISGTPDHISNYLNQKEEMNEIEEGELEKSREYEDSEKDILELHSNDIDLKTELESKNEMLAPIPEKSKWEDDDDNMGQLSPSELKDNSKNFQSGTVSNEVLKRAENVIFTKAINAIKPIEIKKISADRAKFYSGERDDNEVKPVTLQSVAVEKKNDKKSDSSNPPKLSVKDRLGIKVNEPDAVLRIDNVSPFSRRLADRNYAYGERKGEDDKKRDDRSKRDIRNRDHRDKNEKDIRRDRVESHRYKEVYRRDEKRNRSRSKTKTRETERSEKKRRTRSRSGSDDRRDKKRKKEKKQKEKTKKKDEKEEKKEEKQEVPKSATEKRKPTLDEANFEPDYDLESETEDKKAESSSSDSDSSSSSEEERRRKKRKKHRKKKYRKDSSSSSSDSESDSSEEERERKRKKHKKNKKKRKKSKNK